MDVQDNVLCCGCLCAGRKMLLLDDYTRKQCFLHIINEIPIIQPDDLPLWLCWECGAHIRRFLLFKQKVKKSLRTLHDYAKENLNLLQIKQSPCLLIDVVYNINILPNNTETKEDLQTELIKLESDWDQQLICEKDNVKSENDNISIYSEKLYTDTEEETLDKYVKEKKRKKKVKLKIKEKSFKIKKKENILKLDAEYYKFIEYSQEELEEERSQLRMKDEFINAVFKCEKCIVPFPNADDLRDHIALKHDLNANNFKCLTCECSFANEVSLNYHTNKHIKRYECLICTEKFSSKIKVTKHYESYHCGIVCNICHNAFRTQEDYDTHLKSHEDPPPAQAQEGRAIFPCELCDKTFRWKTSLRKHFETHRIQTGQKRKPYCETCRLSFTTTSNLQKHVKTSSKHQILLQLRKLKDSTPVNPAGNSQQEDSIERIKSKVNSARSTYPCPQCDKKFQWKGNLLRHMQSHAARANGELVCEPCNRTFSSIATYKQHMKISKKHVSENDFKYTCNECNRKFANKTRLKDHIDWEHLKNYTHTCDVCQKVFKSHTSLYLHKQVVHKKDNAEHLCDHCGKAFPNHAKLRCHITALHSAVCRYSCSECNARFNWHSCLSRHMRVLHRRGKPTRRGGNETAEP